MMSHAIWFIGDKEKALWYLDNAKQFAPEINENFIYLISYL
jgi:hypothetical protein